MITDINGATAGTQKYFLFFFPCSTIIGNQNNVTMMVVLKEHVMILTMNLATRRKAKKDTPITIVCQFHWYSKIKIFSRAVLKV